MINAATTQTSSLNRRQLLGSVATITATTLVTGPDIAHAHLASAQLPLSGGQPSISLGKVSPITASRIKAILQRNAIRQEAGLPLLSIPQELRRMKVEAAHQAFERFAAIHERSVWNDVLEQTRQAKADPNWKPGLMEGMVLGNRVNLILRDRMGGAEQAGRFPTRSSST